MPRQVAISEFCEGRGRGLTARKARHGRSRARSQNRDRSCLGVSSKKRRAPSPLGRVFLRSFPLRRRAGRMRTACLHCRERIIQRRHSPGPPIEVASDFVRPRKKPSGGGTQRRSPAEARSAFEPPQASRFATASSRFSALGQCPSRSSPGVGCRNAGSRQRRYLRTAWRLDGLPPSRQDHFGSFPPSIGPKANSPAVRRVDVLDRAGGRPSERPPPSGPCAEQVTSLRCWCGSRTRDGQSNGLVLFPLS